MAVAGESGERGTLCVHKEIISVLCPSLLWDKIMIIHTSWDLFGDYWNNVLEASEYYSFSTVEERREAKERRWMLSAFGCCLWSFWPTHLGTLLSLGNLDGEDHAAERTVEDVFLRKFMLGTFPGCLADQLILKRWANQVEICALVWGSYLHTSSTSLWATVRPCCPTFTSVLFVCTSKLFPQGLCISISRTYIKLFTSSCSLRRSETCENGLVEIRRNTSPQISDTLSSELLLNK